MLAVEFKPVNILPEVYEKVMFWVDNCDKEISGFGKVIVKDGAYWVIDAFLLDQEVTGTSTDIDAEALGKLMAETIKQEGHLNWWWHSHVNMGTNWSSTDVDTTHETGKAGFCLSTVFNKKREYRTAYYQGGDDFYPAIYVDKIETRITSLSDESQHEAWKKEMEEKVREKVYPRGNYMGKQTTPMSIPHTSTTPTGGSSYYNVSTGQTVWCQDLNKWVSPDMLKELQGTPDWYQIPIVEKRQWYKVYKMYNGVDAPSLASNELKEFYYEWEPVSSAEQLIAWEA